MVMIPIQSKRIITKYTEFLAHNYCSDNSTQVQDIIIDEELSLHIDDYENYFDGMLVWDASRFHIHLNETRGNTQYTKRGRFSLAHELGHFYIDDHREKIQHGKVSPHKSNQYLVQNNQMEKEADYFASTLLMPTDRFRTFTGGRPFSLNIIEEISDAFQVSLTSAVIRFAEIGTHEIMAVFSKANTAKWYVKSEDFPKLPFRFKVGGQLPPTTVAGEFYTKKNSKYTDQELVDIEDWFFTNEWVPDTQMYEQCFYSDIYDFVISLIWFD